MDNEKKEENFSRDADQTRYIYLVGMIALTALVGLFILEIFGMIKYTLATKGSNGYVPFIFTPEIVHTIIPVTMGTIGVVGGFLFGRSVGQQKTDGDQKANGGQK